MSEPEKLISEMFEKGILVSEDFLNKKLNNELDNNLIGKLDQERDLLVLNNDYLDIIVKQKSLVDWYEIDSYKVKAEKERDDELYQAQLQQFRHSDLYLEGTGLIQKQKLTSLESEMMLAPEGQKSSLTFSSDLLNDQSSEYQSSEYLISSPELLPQLSSPSKVEIIINYKNEPRKYEVKDFTQLFISRYRFLESILRQRQELQGVMPINRLLTKKEKESVSIISLIDNIGETKNGNIILTVEDLTGKIKVVFSKNKKETFQKAKELVLDEVVGITGILGDKIIFGEEIVWPDIPLNNQLKKSELEEYAIFLSDIHVGSKLFLKDEFNKFLRWINAEAGNPAQKEIAKKVKYIIIAGDLVDGIGIYPSQQDELAVHDIIAQYE